jgi:hypothetical protein
VNIQSKMNFKISYGKVVKLHIVESDRFDNLDSDDDDDDVLFSSVYNIVTEI